ncbi:MAG: ATP-dependent helicase, partial [Saprospiraceae bacterium]|nr:ATP-dependent helicase [Saprospiraceae bacterium]
MTKIKSSFLTVWEKAYHELNVKQKEAVDTLEGPVMTIAGPGTGKTQLLAVRIGNILLNTDIFPHNILCLTYTDSGAISMRQRLESFIGPEAFNVNIYTFHAFCNNVIKENLQYFGDFRELQLVSDIEEADVYRELINSFDDKHPLKRYKSDEYFEARRLKNLFTIMKQEKWTIEKIRNAHKAYKDILLDPLRSPHVYKKRTTDKNSGEVHEVGDLKLSIINKELEKYEKSVAAANELSNYDKILASRERFDYHDMILWVIEKFKNHDELLGKYQERFQYLLVDEYQDTNGSQNELLFLLADYWDRPNLFIVGDDDQSIFRFQGANMNSILDFKNKYNPKEIVLSENYRSSQKILDRAKILIENNEERLVNKFPYLIKDLTESRKEKPAFSPEPQIIEYLNEAQEETGIIHKILELNQNGVALKNIAVLYTRHKNIENLVRYFLQNKIAVNVKKRVNVLFENEVFRITNILEYLDNEFNRPHSSEDLLFEIMHYDFFDLDALDIASIALFCRKRSDTDDNKSQYNKWREVISDINQIKEAGVKNIEAVLSVSNTLESWLKDIMNVTIQTLIEKILTESNMLHRVLRSPDKSWKLQLINTFFDFVKNESAKVKQLSLKQMVALVNLMRETNIELPVYRIISNENGINFMTVHGAKGLEFDHVFMMRGNQNMWEDKKGRNDNYSFPPSLVKSTSENSQEDDRRLFYVALTRARDFLYISYPEKNEEEKSVPFSKFIAEIKHEHNEVVKARVADEDVLTYKSELMKYKQGEVKLIDNELVDKILSNFKISATSLNKYLKCKLA